MKKGTIFSLILMVLMIMILTCDKCAVNPEEEDKPQPESPVTDFGSVSLCVPEYGATSLRIVLVWSCDDTSTAVVDSAELTPDYWKNGFNIHRSTKSTFTTASIIANVKSPEPNEYFFFLPDGRMEYHDNNVQSQTTYYYWITYIYPNGSESKVRAMDPPGWAQTSCLPPVTGIQGTCNGIDCVWTWDAYPEADRYRVFRWDSNDNQKGLIDNILTNTYTWLGCNGGAIAVKAYLSWEYGLATCPSEIVSCIPIP